MLTAPHLGSLELRRSKGGAVRLKGSFPYNTLATLSDGGRRGGRPRKEQFASGAFSYVVEDPDRDVMFLSGHRFDKPLASRKAGTLHLEDTDTALTMEAELTPEIQETSWARDFLSAHRAGLVLGLSPGFRIPPKSAVPNAEKVEEEDPRLGRALIRTVFAAVLFELSAVTKAAYESAHIEEKRNWTPEPGTRLPQRRHAAVRWR